MKIICGFEAEYDPMKTKFLGELRDKVDYMILGEHYVPYGMEKVPQKNNPEYPIQYAEMLCAAMESGIFDIVAHPDIFMQFRDSQDTEEKKKQFMENAKIASKKICDKAKELAIPLELNFAGMNKGKHDIKYTDGEFAYPHSEFWQIASETGVLVLYGVDAHNPEQFLTIAKDQKQADMIIDHSKLNLVDKNYNPQEARKNNKKLNELYQQSQAKALTYETHMITQIISGIIDRIPEQEFTPETFAMISENTLANIAQNSNKKASKIKHEAELGIETIPTNSKLTAKEKKFQLKRTKTIIEHTGDTLTQQHLALERAGVSINTSIAIGCQSKQEFKTAITQITEAKTTNNKERKNTIEQKITTQALANSQKYQQEKGNAHVLKKKSSNNTNKGYANTITLVLIITFACSIVVGISYMLYKISIS